MRLRQLRRPRLHQPTSLLRSDASPGGTEQHLGHHETQMGPKGPNLGPLGFEGPSSPFGFRDAPSAVLSYCLSSMFSQDRLSSMVDRPRCFGKIECPQYFAVLTVLARASSCCPQCLARSNVLRRRVRLRVLSSLLGRRICLNHLSKPIFHAGVRCCVLHHRPWQRARRVAAVAGLGARAAQLVSAIHLAEVASCFHCLLVMGQNICIENTCVLSGCVLRTSVFAGLHETHVLRTKRTWSRLKWLRQASQLGLFVLHLAGEPQASDFEYVHHILIPWGLQFGAA